MQTENDPQDFIQRLIQRFDLQPLPGEGGLFAQTYRSPVTLPGGRPLSTAILYLLTSDPASFSALHRLRSDEVYHFYLGDPVEMLLLLSDGSSQHVTLGPDVLAGQMVQFTVPGGVWQGSRLAQGGRFALLGTTMSPGWDEREFELGQRAELKTMYSKEGEGIDRLTHT